MEEKIVYQHFVLFRIDIFLRRLNELERIGMLNYWMWLKKFGEQCNLFNTWFLLIWDTMLVTTVRKWIIEDCDSLEITLSKMSQNFQLFNKIGKFSHSPDFMPTDMSYKSYMFNAELVSASGLLIEIRTNGLPIVLWAFLRQLSTKQHNNEDEVGLRNNKGNRFDIISLQLIKFILGIAGWIRLRATVPNLQLEITQNMLQRGERSNYIMFHIICGV